MLGPKDVREMLQGEGLPIKLVKVLEGLAEDNKEVHRKMFSLVGMMNKLIDIMNLFTQGLGGAQHDIKKQLAKFGKNDPKEGELASEPIIEDANRS